MNFLLQILHHLHLFFILNNLKVFLSVVDTLVNKFRHFRWVFLGKIIKNNLVWGVKNTCKLHWLKLGEQFDSINLQPQRLQHNNGINLLSDNFALSLRVSYNLIGLNHIFVIQLVIVIELQIFFRWIWVWRRSIFWGFYSLLLFLLGQEIICARLLDLNSEIIFNEFKNITAEGLLDILINIFLRCNVLFKQLRFLL